jgi:YVTN family beta-propeller protein
VIHIPRLRLPSVLCAALLLAATVTPATAAPLAYVLNQGSNDVSEIDLATNGVVDAIPLGSPAGAFDVGIGGGQAIATGPLVSGGFFPRGHQAIAASQTLSRVYMSHVYESPSGVTVGAFTVIDTDTKTVLESTRRCADDVAVDPSGTRLALLPTIGRVHRTAK